MSTLDRLRGIISERGICGSSEAVALALQRLGAQPPQAFIEFYQTFDGPFGTDVMGYQLLDLLDQNPSIISATETCRERFGFSEEWLVISDLVANGFLVYNWKSDKIFDVSFERDFERLRRGEVASRWDSFESFLIEFFNVENGGNLPEPTASPIRENPSPFSL